MENTNEQIPTKNEVKKSPEEIEAEQMAARDEELFHQLEAMSA